MIILYIYILFKLLFMYKKFKNQDNIIIYFKEFYLKLLLF